MSVPRTFSPSSRRECINPKKEKLIRSCGRRSVPHRYILPVDNWVTPTTGRATPALNGTPYANSISVRCTFVCMCVASKIVSCRCRLLPWLSPRDGRMDSAQPIGPRPIWTTPDVSHSVNPSAVRWCTLDVFFRPIERDAQGRQRKKSLFNFIRFSVL